MNRIKYNNDKEPFSESFEKSDLDSQVNSSSKEGKKLGQFELISYDLEYDGYFKLNVHIPVIKDLEGLSEVNMKGNLYLCGTNPDSNGAENEGGFLFKISPGQSMAQILINSKFSHVNPSLICDDNNNFIYCIGGHNQVKCEVYDVAVSKWISLPDLEEERYKSSLIIFNKFELTSTPHLYLFGGLNSKSRAIEQSILKLNLNDPSKWEKIEAQDPSFVPRISAGCVAFKNSDEIFVFGGETVDGEMLDDVIKVNTRNNKYSYTGNKLKNKTKFINLNGMELTENIYYFIDYFNQAHDFHRTDFMMIAENEMSH